MNTVTYKEKEYKIPGSFGQLKAKVAIELYSLIGKIPSNEISINDYNFQYVSLILGIPVTELEDDEFDSFMKILNDINAILTTKSEPKLDETVEAPAVE